MSNAYSPIPELNLLKEFEDHVKDWYSHGFSLRDYNWDVGVDVWLEDSAEPNYPEFYDRVIPFAKATISGSVYALWRCDERADLATLPIIFFGDEGDLTVDARNLRDLFRLLAVEDKDGGPVPARQDYLAWLNQNFGLTPPEDPAEITWSAMQEYGWRFADWMLQLGATEDAVGPLIESLDLFDIPRP